MIFDRPIHIDASNILVNANVAITEADLKKLTTWGIDAIETSGKEIKDVAKLEKKYIPVEYLKPGMIFDQPTYIDSSNILTEADVAITEADIKKLTTWGVDIIETYGDEIKSASDLDKSLSKKQIIKQYNDLLKKRKDLISIHTKAQTVVGEVYSCIKADKPFTVDRIESSVVDIINLLKQNQRVFLFLYGFGESKNYLVTHSVHVAFYAIILGMALNYTTSQLIELGTGAMLVDAGMMKIPIYIINKQGKLTEKEYNQIKTHPLLGYKAFKQLTNVSDNIADISLQHHEQFDGKGYPRGLKGDEILELANIVSIADCYEAQISNRSYKKKIYFHNAMKNLISTGANKFNPRLLNSFLPSLSLYPIGSIVQFNDQSIGIVIGSSPDKPLRPVVKLIFDDKKRRVKDLELINLIEKPDIYILKALEESEAKINIFDVL
jgi:HD-GYP domain-containing protein (c-di-GMP phosphodiesterase class II)